MIHVDGRRLGKKPPKHDHRTLRLARYLTDKLPAPPAKIDHAALVRNWQMLLNDQLGDCGPAGAAHQDMSWAAFAGKPYGISDAQVKAWYFGITGGADDGVYILDMANYWRKHGLGNDTLIEAFIGINPNLTEAKLAIQLFGSAGIGLSLPDVNTFGPWLGDYGPPNPNNGHYVCLVGYDDARQMFTVITWGEAVDMSYNFFLKYCDEGYAFLNDLSLNPGSEVSPEGFNFAQLSDDLQHLGDPVTPDQPPPGPITPPTPKPPWWQSCLGTSVIALTITGMLFSLCLLAR
jgi:hypothetical protein